MKGEHPECFCEAQKAAEFIFPELAESEGERIKKEIIAFLRSKNGYMTPDEDWDFHNRWIVWLEKQGEQTQLDYEHADIPQKDFAPIEHKMLNADDVIEWFRMNGWNSHIGNPIDEFKKDFGL